jgi:SAM-dependent methyltransferase
VKKSIKISTSSSAHPRIAGAQLLIRLGRFIQSLAVMFMRPDDLTEFSRRFYAHPSQVKHWTSEEFVAQGLNDLEKALLEKVPLRGGPLLLLGVGGGREAIPLARLGFAVTGVDFVPGMTALARENAARQGLCLETEVQEVSRLQAPEASYDLAWLSNSMYSSIPTRERRVAMLKKIYRALKPGGYFICTFHWEPEARFSPRVEQVRRMFALLTLGNLWYESGDLLWGNAEFIHAFASEAELAAEFAEAGFTVVFLQTPSTGVEGGVVLRR